MKFQLLKILILVLVIFTLRPAQAQIEDLKRKFYLETGDDQVKTGLRICDSLQEEESELLAFSVKLLEIASKAATKGLLLARVEKAVADGFFYSDSLESSNEHLLRAIAIAETTDPADSLFLADVYNDLGLNCIDLGETDVAADYLNRSIRIFRNANKPDDLANALSNLATLHYTKGQHEEAISLYNEVYQIDLKTGNKRNQSGSLNNIGRMNVEWGKYQSGLEYYHRSIELLDTIVHRDILAIRYNNIGSVYQLMGNHSEAISFFNKAMAIDSSEGNIIKISIRQYNLGNSYLALNDFKNARIHLEQAESYFRKTKMYSKLSKVYGSLGQLYRKQGDMSAAEGYFLKGRDMAERGETLPERAQAYSGLHQFYKSAGSFEKALFFYELKTIAEDSIFNLKASEKIEELEAQYQNEKKEAEITRLESDNELKINELTFRKRERNWALAGITIMGILLLGMYHLFSTVKRQKSILQTQNQELDRLNHAQNSLFGIISHDLRNVAAAYLASARIIEYHLGKGQPEKLMRVATEINRNAKNLSALLENLLQWAVIQIKGIEPDKQLIWVKEELELAKALFAEVAENKSNSIVISAADETVWCDRESFRLIVRNLLSNAIKFTSTGTISLVAFSENGCTKLKVSDTGCGISPDNQGNLFNIGKSKVKQGTAGEKGTGLGLPMVARHLETNGGKIQIESEENVGTTFILSFPSVKK